MTEVGGEAIRREVGWWFEECDQLICRHGLLLQRFIFIALCFTKYTTNQGNNDLHVKNDYIIRIHSAASHL